MTEFKLGSQGILSFAVSAADGGEESPIKSFQKLQKQAEEMLAQAGYIPLCDVGINNIKSVNGTVSADATVPVKPDLSGLKYRGVKAPYELKPVTDKEIKEYMRIAVRQHNGMRRTEKTPGSGDMIEFYIVSENGEKKYHDKFGSPRIAPELSQTLSQMMPGNEKTMDNGDRVRLTAVWTDKTWTLSDEFVAENIPGMKTLAEFSDYAAKQVKEQHIKAADASFEQAVRAELAKAVAAPIPDIMVGNIFEVYKLNLESYAKKNNKTVDEVLAAANMSLREYLEKGRPAAVAQIKSSLALEYIAQQERLELTEEERSELKKKYAENERKAEINKKIQNPPFDIVLNEALMHKALRVAVDSAEKVPV